MDPVAELIGESPSMVALRAQVARLLRHHGASPRLPPVLIEGETGTGKGLLASALHRASRRAAGPFVAVNCAAIPETLLEAEMFGFERGAFTDARQAKPGLFEAAHRGTIFLDEIGLLPEGLQAKLLKAIEEREVRRLGSTRSESVDVWILTATSEDLARARQARSFHEALYHRLSVLTFRLPPLRERGEDVLLLARHLLQRVCRDYGVPIKPFAPDIEAALRAHPWPGNIRELANAIERAALLAEGPLITAENLGLERDPVGGHGRGVTRPAMNLGEAVSTVEREHILSALTETGWNVSHAADRLGIPRTSLSYRIQKLGLQPAERPRGRRRPSPSPEPDSSSAGPMSFVAAPDIRWEGRHLALLRVALASDVATPTSTAVAALESLLEKVQSFGGRLEEIGPTGLLASFGLEPVEDAPVRAADAALAMQKAATHARQAAHPPVRLTVALHCGPVMMTGQVQGTWQLALDDKRAAVQVLDGLLARAAPDHIVVSPSAARLLARRFQLEEAPAPDGSEDSVHRLVGLEPTGLGLGGRALSRFVGRDRELIAVRDLLRQVEQGAGHAVGLIGEPGVGKSRLLYEFRQGLTGERLLYLEGHCLSYRSTTPYGPVQGVLRQACAISESDPSHTVAEKIRAALRVVGLDPDNGAPYLLHVLGLAEGSERLPPFSPETIKIETFETLRRFLLQQSRRQPVVLAIEDLHWTDKTSEEFLASLVDGLAGAPILVFATYRPGYRPSWIDKSYVTQLTLPPLSPKDSRVVVDSAPGSAAAPPALTQAIVERAEGNPFFLEELAWAIAEPAGSDEPAKIPDTVQGAILVRISRLPEERKRLLQTASVLGRECPARLLHAVCEGPGAMTASLRELQRLEFLNERPGVDEPVYVFKHALTQEVAYASLPPEERRALHGRIVDAVERQYAERLDEHVETLAHHARQGGLREKAVRYLRQAGLKATARSAPHDARAWFEQALGVLEALPENPFTLEQAFEVRLELKPVLNQLGEIRRTVERLREAETLAERLDDDRRRGRVCALVTNLHSLLGELDDAYASGARALAIARALGDLELRILSTSYLEQAHYYRGEYERVVELATDNLAALPADRVHEHFGITAPAAIYNRCWLIMSLAQLGRFAEAAEYEAQAIGLAKPTDHAFTVGTVYYTAGTLHLLKGEWAEARSLIEHGLTVVRTGNVVLHLPRMVTSSAWARAQLGEASEALDRLQEGEQLLGRQAARGYVGIRGWDFQLLGRASLLLGRLDEARRLGERAIESSPSHPGFAAHALRLLGDIATHPDRFDAESGEAHYRQALALAEARGMRPLVAHCHRGLGTLYRSAGQKTQAEEHLAVAAAAFRDMDMRFWLQGAEAELASMR